MKTRSDDAPEAQSASWKELTLDFAVTFMGLIIYAD